MSAQKVIVVDANPFHLPGKEVDLHVALGSLGAMTGEKVSAIFDWCYCFQGESKRFNIKKARTYLKVLGQFPHPLILMLGLESLKTLGCAGQSECTPFQFEWNGGSHLGIWIRHPLRESGHFKTGLAERIGTYRVLKDLLRIASVTVTHKDAREVIAVVNLQPDVLSFWTKKIRDEILKKIEDGYDVEKYDLGQLMASYGNDLSFVKEPIPGSTGEQIDE